MLVLKRGSHGVDVLSVQKRLKELGDYDGDLDGMFGRRMGQGVKQFQARAGLTIDEVVGPITLAALFPDARGTGKVAAMPDLPGFHMTVLQVARRQVGVREHGQNRGPEVERYLASVGLDPGNPYCLAGLYWCAKQASAICLVTNPMLKSGHCETFYRWAKGKGYLVAADKARPSDIGIMLFGGGKGHAVLISQIKTVGSWNTVEFNTNVKGEREGEGVRDDRVRRWSELAGIVRLPAPVPLGA